MIPLYLPFIFQGVFLALDEFYFHERRSLPRWEKIGHPLDTLTALLTLCLPAFVPYNNFTSNIYLILAVFSCLFITKDEFVHKDNCSKAEHWLHAMLFLLHPLTFIASLIIWIKTPENFFLKLQPLMIGSFMIYQMIRWNGVEYEPIDKD